MKVPLSEPIQALLASVAQNGTIASMYLIEEIIAKDTKESLKKPKHFHIHHTPSSVLGLLY
jgi:hypothetical protein